MVIGASSYPAVTLCGEVKEEEEEEIDNAFCRVEVDAVDLWWIRVGMSDVGRGNARASVGW